MSMQTMNPQEVSPYTQVADYNGRWMMTISFVLLVVVCIQSRYYIWRLEQRVEALEHSQSNPTMKGPKP